MRVLLARLLTASVLLLAPQLLFSAEERIRIVANDAARRVDVLIDGAPFTSYIYPATLKKPVLYPLRTARGTTITRGFPLEPRAGERVDHPHHAGLWFQHGDVNGLDFWNNSEEVGGDRALKMGTILHRRVVEAKSGTDRGELGVESDWVDPQGIVLLRETTRFIFRGANDMRSIDRITTLTAAGGRVTFRDNKEGVLGMRVARALEQPAEKPEVFSDASGKPTKVPRLDNTGVTGSYTSSEGKKGDAVWGTRGRWVTLQGTMAPPSPGLRSPSQEPVTVLMLDHPGNPGFPTYWHARGYGLFSANPLGRKVFDDKQPELVLTLEPAQSVSFRHRILIMSGPVLPEAIEREYRSFTQ